MIANVNVPGLSCFVAIRIRGCGDDSHIVTVEQRVYSGSDAELIHWSCLHNLS